MISLDVLRRALRPLPAKTRLDDCYPFLEETYFRYAVNTPLREAMFLAQYCHETDHFCALEEYASGAAYEGRKDLGNTEPGDGVRYKGRGWPQLSGRWNYAKFSVAVFGSEDLLLTYPARVAEPELAVKAGGWFWGLKGLNYLADRADLEGCTRRINGGLNGLAERTEYFTNLCHSLGI